MGAVREGDLLWTPSPQRRAEANLTRYLAWLHQQRGLRFDDYQALWAWSATEIEPFWESVWDYFQVRAASPPRATLLERRMPGAVWFPGAELNFAEHAFRHASPDRPAIISKSELRPLATTSWEDLRRQVAALAATLRRMGVRRGDRVAAYLPNIPEAIIALLACASLGAIWSSCAPEFGERSVLDRFRQIEPTVLIAVDGYRYAGKDFDRRATVAALRRALPSVRHLVLVPYLQPDGPQHGLEEVVEWKEAVRDQSEPLRFDPVPFDHPLWILYSSGTTGLPKAIVHGHGGALLEALKGLTFHLDVKPGDRFFWFSSTGWVMWNIVAESLLAGATAVTYDGSPAYPDLGALWRLADEAGITSFGVSAAFIGACLRAGLEPGRACDLSRMRSIGSTGSPLPPEGFQWVYERVKEDVWLAPISGGTDVVAGFVGGCPLLPVTAGEHQCRLLGVNVQAFDEQGRSLVDQVGELVVTEPMPSMPLFFWNDPGGARYRESYFEMYPGVWRHGDWIRITARGTAVISGRSDSTLNRQGVRMGTSEIYGVVEALPEIADSLVIGVELPGGGYFMPLFVVPGEGVELDEALRTRIRARLRESLSPRHVPDEIVAVPAVPRTLNGKKLEVPIKKLFMGVPLEQAVALGAVANPEAVAAYQELAEAFRRRLEATFPAPLPLHRGRGEE